MITKSASEASLTDLERRLADFVTRGELLDLADDKPVDEAAMRSWDSSRTIRAVVLRDILRGRLAPDPDPHGLRLRGARIAGRLDLENLTTRVSLELSDCLLGEGLVARDASLPFLTLSGCWLEHPTEPPLDADRLTATAMVLNRAVITADCETGAVRLSGAHLGTLDCTGATVRNHTGPALDADGLQVDRDVLLSGGFKAVGAGEGGAVRLLGAHIGRDLDCTGATVRNDSGPALHADSLQVSQSVFLSRGFEAVGAGELGAVRLLGAHLGRLECKGATIRNGTGPALRGDNLQVDRNVHLRKFQAVGGGEDAAVWLLSAHLGGRLACYDTTMRNDTGLALLADMLRVDQDVFLRGGFQAVGGGEDGAVRLRGAHLGGLDCTDATIHNDSGPAVFAFGLQVDQSVSLGGGFEAIGAGDAGAVVLAGAHIHGLLDCSGATLRNDSGPALNAYQMQVDQGALLVGEFKAVSGGSGEHQTLNLADVRVGGVLAFAPAKLEHTADRHARLFVDGLTYPGLPRRISPRDWLHMLREATPWYTAQPYQQLAAAHRAAGHDGEARRVLMAQRRDQIDRRALTGRGERAWARLTGVTLGYGYQPWRALLALVAIALTAVVLTVTLGAHGGVARVDPHPPTATQCSAVERVGVGLDLGLPLIKTGIRDHCDTTASATGQVLTVAGWGLQLLAWGFATLFVAGFTGAVRKT